eukprot:329409-Pyramimonas_sp.AAC.1
MLASTVPCLYIDGDVLVADGPLGKVATKTEDEMVQDKIVHPTKSHAYVRIVRVSLPGIAVSPSPPLPLSVDNTR